MDVDDEGTRGDVGGAAHGARCTRAADARAEARDAAEDLIHALRVGQGEHYLGAGLTHEGECRLVDVAADGEADG